MEETGLTTMTDVRRATDAATMRTASTLEEEAGLSTEVVSVGTRTALEVEGTSTEAAKRKTGLVTVIVDSTTTTMTMTTTTMAADSTIMTKTNSAVGTGTSEMSTAAAGVAAAMSAVMRTTMADATDAVYPSDTTHSLVCAPLLVA